MTAPSLGRSFRFPLERFLLSACPYSPELYLSGQTVSPNRKANSLWAQVTLFCPLFLVIFLFRWHFDLCGADATAAYSSHWYPQLHCYMEFTRCPP